MNVKRPAILFLGAFIYGIIIASSQISINFKLILGVVAIFLYLKLIFDRKLTIRVMIFVLVICDVGFLRFKEVESRFDGCENRVLELGKGSKRITGKVLSIGKSTNSNYMIIENCSSAGMDLGTARVYFNDDVKNNAKIGNLIMIDAGTTTIDAPSNEGEFNQKNHYRSNNIAFIAFAKNIEVINEKQNIVKQKIYETKLIIKDQIGKIFEDRDIGLFMAMLTGDRSEIDKIQKKTYTENGIAHIIAISGLHLSILGLALFEILRKFLSINTAAGITSIFVCIYGIFIDASSASLRAIIMLYVRFLSLAFGRTYDSKNALYIICFLFLFTNPYLLFNAGFQFSYIAIFALNHEAYINKRKPVRIHPIITLNLFLFPVTIYHYFTYPLYSVFLNLVVIPLMPLVLGVGLLGLLVSFLYVQAGVVIVKVIHFIFLIYDKLCLSIGKLPYHLLWLGRPTLYEVLYYYIALFLILYAIGNLYIVPRIGKFMHKGQDICYDNKNKIYTYRFFNTIRLSLCIVLFIMSILIIGIRKKNDCRITFISIGQGDSILIESNNTILSVDGGSTSNTSNGEYILVPHMKSRSINHIDYAFITHADSDHTNGIMYLLDNEYEVDIDNLILPINAKTDTKFNKIKSLAYDRGVKVSYMMEMDRLEIADKINITTLSPDIRSLSNKKMDQNELSLTFRMDYKNHSCLFTGDIGNNTMKRMVGDKYANENIKSDVLKVPHHGSKNSNVKEFFDIVNPEYAVVSYGNNNNYGHPNADTLKSIMDTGANVLKTGEKGQIDIYFDKEEIYYKTYK